MVIPFDKERAKRRQGQFTFEVCSDDMLQTYGYGGVLRNLYTEEYDTADKHSLFIGQVIALFGEPENRTSDNENLFSKAVSAKDSLGNVLYFEVYYGPSGPAIAGGNGEKEMDQEYRQKVADKLAEYIMAAKPADFEWKSVYGDLDMTIIMGVKNGKPYYESKVPEEWWND